MSRDTYHEASDGFRARNADTWTEEKLMILHAYANGFAQACKSAGGWYGLDLFSGTGMNYSTTRLEEMPGSPLILLEAGAPKATKVLCSEGSRRNHAALSARCEPYGARAVIYPRGDANELVPQMLADVPVRAPAFAFLDPEGSELHWSTVEAIAAHKRAQPRKVEQLILFPTDTGFVRLIADHPEKVDRMFGHGRWREIAAARLAERITADEARGDYVRLYGDGLRELGYATVLDKQMQKQSGSPLYFLIFATDHPAGRRIMDSCFDKVKLRVIEELGQGRLFDMAEPRVPRRTRLGEDGLG
ncbi:MAG: three-Cys-motif partner protein TcmP [Thermoleophilaceae bacterium]|nr:three-Cys-motif partner protein TcmP [Thermoleophilaceae bacterium]